MKLLHRESIQIDFYFWTERDVFVAENGAVIYDGEELYDYRAFNFDFYQS